jgi:hypothetical protein
MSPYGKVEFERRVFPRFKIDIPIYYEIETRPVLEGRAGNISEGGLLIYLPHSVAVGDQLLIRLHMTDPKAPRLIEAVGAVMWSKPTGGGEPDACKVGLRFVDIRPEDLTYIRQFQSLWLEQE